MKKEPKFKEGDWVRFVGGPDKGRTTTLTSVTKYGNGYSYFGYFCGRPVSGNDEQTEAY